VDPQTGLARSRTANGNGEAPRAEINTLAGLVNRCAATAGGRQGDGSPCGRLFQAAAGGKIDNTLEAVQSIARNGGGEALSEWMIASSPESGAFQPALSTPPSTWKLAVKFDAQSWNGAGFAAPWIDKSGNVWTFNIEDRSITEFIGAAALEPEFEPVPADNSKPAGKP
jgi:hypothetical protein